MDLITLEYFIKVAEKEHITKAAEELNISQPALTKSIHRLEDEVGYPLFDRSGKRITISRYGKIYYQSVKEALQAIQTGMDQMEELKKRDYHFWNIGCSASKNNTTTMNKLLDEGYNIQVSGAPESVENSLLEEKKLDLVISSFYCENPKIDTVILNERKWYFTVGMNHPLASRMDLKLEELLDWKFAGTNNNLSQFGAFNSNYPDTNFHPRIAYLGRDSQDILETLLNGDYIALMPENQVRRERGVVPLKLTDCQPVFPVRLYWRSEDDGNRTLRKIREQIIECYKNYH